MNIKKFLTKMAQLADFQTPVEPVIEEPVGQPAPEAEQGVVDNSIDKTGPLAPVQPSPTMVQTNVAIPKIAALKKFFMNYISKFPADSYFSDFSTSLILRSTSACSPCFLTTLPEALTRFEASVMTALKASLWSITRI